MHKQWNIISRDLPELERNSGIKIPVKMTRDPETEPLVGSSVTNTCVRPAEDELTKVYRLRRGGRIVRLSSSVINTSVRRREMN